MRALALARSLVYRRRASPLHAARATVAAAYGAALAVAALLTEHPLLLGSLLVCVLAAGAAAGVGRQLARAGAAGVAPILVLSVLVNALASRNGLTVIARLGDWGVLGQVDVTEEAIVYGLVFALRMIVVGLACVLVLCAADPDELLVSIRRVAPVSALTAAIATRMLPVLAGDARRLAEAQRCRAGSGGRTAILRASVAGALDRSLDVAAVLEMRGYGARRSRRAPDPRPPSRHDLAFAAAAVAILAAGVLVALGVTGAFDAYPLVRVSTSPSVYVLAAVLPLCALAPFLDRRGIEP